MRFPGDPWLFCQGRGEACLRKGQFATYDRSLAILIDQEITIALRCFLSWRQGEMDGKRIVLHARTVRELKRLLPEISAGSHGLGSCADGEGEGQPFPMQQGGKIGRHFLELRRVTRKEGEKRIRHGVKAGTWASAPSKKVIDPLLPECWRDMTSAFGKGICQTGKEIGAKHPLI